MITLTKYDRATDYCNFFISSIEEDGADLPTSINTGAVYVGVNRCCFGSIAIDSSMNQYILTDGNTWELCSNGTSSGTVEFTTDADIDALFE